MKLSRIILILLILSVTKTQCQVIVSNVTNTDNHPSPTSLWPGKYTTAQAELLFGAWIPHGNLAIIGTHPFFGFRGGVEKSRYTANLTVGFRFGSSPEYYKVSKDDSVYHTDHFFGGYIGLDLGCRLVSFRKNRFDLIGGIAFDGFDALKVKDHASDDYISKSINSLNLNIGLGYKYYLNRNIYCGIDLKYNFVDYQNHYGTDLTGNTMTINMIFGFRGKIKNRVNYDNIEVDMIAMTLAEIILEILSH